MTTFRVGAAAPTALDHAPGPPLPTVPTRPPLSHLSPLSPLSPLSLVPLGGLSVRQLLRELVVAEHELKRLARAEGRSSSPVAAPVDVGRSAVLQRQRCIIVELKARRDAVGRNTAASRRRQLQP